MSKRKNWVHQLVSERYFVWAVVFTAVVVGGVLGQIAVAKTELDTDASATSFSAVSHSMKTPLTHKRK